MSLVRLILDVSLDTTTTVDKAYMKGQIAKALQSHKLAEVQDEHLELYGILAWLQFVFGIM